MTPFHVPSEGTGRPDFSPIMGISRPQIALDQERWSALVTRRASDGNAIPAESVGVVTLNPVPLGFDLYLGLALISCSTDCIQQVVMAHTPGIVGDYRYKLQGLITFGILSATVIKSGEAITIYIFNLDIVERDFSITLQGILQKVGS